MKKKLRNIFLKKYVFRVWIPLSIFVVSISIAIPLIVKKYDKTDHAVTTKQEEEKSNTQKTILKPKWSPALPKVFYETNESDRYTVHIENSKGFKKKLQVKINEPKKLTDTILVDGKVYQTKIQKYFDQKLPETLFWRLKNDGSKAPNITSNREKAFDYIKEKAEIKPKISNTLIKTSNGGDRYDQNKWTWIQTQGGKIGNKIMIYEFIRIKGEKIRTSVGKNQLYNYNKKYWKWIELDSFKDFSSLFFGIDLRRHSPKLTLTGKGTIDEKSRIIDSLFKNKKLLFKNKKLYLTDIEVKSPIAGLNLSETSYETIMPTKNLKAKLFDVVVAEIKTSNNFPSLKNKKVLDNVLKNYAQFRATYNGFELASFDVFAYADQKPSGVPKNFNKERDVEQGGKLIDTYYYGKKPDVYMPSYNNIVIPLFKKEHYFTKESDRKAPKGAPKDFQESQYSKGNPHVNKQEPKQLDIQKLINENNVGGKIVVDNQNITLKERLMFDFSLFKNKNTKFYLDKNKKYVTNIKQASEYNKFKLLVKPVKINNLKVGSTIYIDNKKYSFN